MFSTTPFALQNGSHSADLFRQAASSLVPPGGGIITAGDLAVSQTGTPSMNVSVGVGRCWIPGTNVGNVVGGNFSSQAMYYSQNASAYTAAVTPSDSVNPRIDVVYAAVQDSQYAGATNAGVIAVAAGAPTSGATYPANAPVLPANSIALAWINVAANASSIVNANITNITNPSVSPSTGLTAQTNQTGGSTFSASGVELQISSVNAYLIAGRTYRLRASIDAQSNTSGTYVQYRLKYGNTGGITGTNTRGPYIAAYATANLGQSFDITGQPFIAPATGNSSCVLTAQIVVNTGATITTGASTPAPLSITVEDLG